MSKQERLHLHRQFNVLAARCHVVLNQMEHLRTPKLSNSENKTELQNNMQEMQKLLEMMRSDGEQLENEIEAVFFPRYCGEIDEMMDAGDEEEAEEGGEEQEKAEKRRRKLNFAKMKLDDIKPTGDDKYDRRQIIKLKAEFARLARNNERREGRERWE
ncbi:hypothetical protein EK21DRAFT_114980 [Setomelanomma holmii]|uniref:Uncharacterized protein n=1 Tax=Setomelanomma holmii TaxID=210430 RepID=A0A9P4H507_9PLEO|nr:hypothetical protein EK21DRAFT_114980 [Setomelanomma holmii]